MCEINHALVEFLKTSKQIFKAHPNIICARTVMVPMDQEHLDFFRRAEECMNKARQQQNIDLKEELLRLAAQWTLLAMAREKFVCRKPLPRDL